MPAFTKALSVGNRVLDLEHSKLHDIINEIASLILKGEVASLLEKAELFENCLCAYFSVEEHIAKTVGFDFTQHSQAHQSLLAEYRRIKASLIEKNGNWSSFEAKGYAETLRNCLIRHITDDSKPLKMVLDTHYYDLKLGKF